ncbi:MAG: hypothetical protein QG630_290 [Patescibacteria group bacterium]|nr:hypothetical protein [Patescibacteria group bacterium]
MQTLPKINTNNNNVGIRDILDKKEGLCRVINEEDKKEGASRTLLKISKTTNKTIGPEITQRYDSKTKRWIDRKDFLYNKDIVVVDENSTGKNNLNKTAIQMFRPLVTSFVEKKKNGKESLYSEEVKNVLDFKNEKFNKTETERNNLSGSEFQDYCIRFQIWNLKAEINERISSGKMKAEIKLFIGSYGKKNLENENQKRKRKGEFELTEGEYLSILEAGITAAYIYAEDYVKNKKENVELCTNDKLDHKKIDYEEVVFDENNSIETVYFIQIKSNREQASASIEDNVKSHQEYLNSFNVLSKEEFVKLGTEEIADRLNSKAVDENSNFQIKKNILSAKTFISRTIFVDIRNNEIEILDERPLTFKYS